MYSNNVNEFDTDKLKWKEIGRMKIGRQHHAISQVKVNEEFLTQNCLNQGDFLTPIQDSNTS